MNRKRTAVYGGSFNPIHEGHIALAEHILKNDIADEVLFMPVADPPHKPSKDLAPYAHRCNMIYHAIWRSVLRGLQVGYSTLEDELPKPSYTLQTLDALSSRMMDTEFAWVIGADELNQLHTWAPDPIRLVRSYDFIFYLRQGVSVDLAELNQHWPGWICKKLLDGVVYDANLPQVSASTIRSQLETWINCPECLPASVYKYIINHQLYGKGGNQ